MSCEEQLSVFLTLGNVLVEIKIKWDHVKTDWDNTCRRYH